MTLEAEKAFMPFSLTMAPLLVPVAATGGSEQQLASRRPLALLVPRFTHHGRLFRLLGPCRPVLADPTSGLLERHASVQTVPDLLAVLPGQALAALCLVRSLSPQGKSHGVFHCGRYAGNSLNKTCVHPSKHSGRSFLDLLCRIWYKLPACRMDHP